MPTRPKTAAALATSAARSESGPLNVSANAGPSFRRFWKFSFRQNDRISDMLGDLADRVRFAEQVIASLRLGSELRAWRASGRRANLWWRDDDARAPTAALDRLLACADVGATPLCLAVIPDGDVRGFPDLLARRPWVSIIQHGVDHLNRRDGPRAGEFPATATEEDIRRRLGEVVSRLDGLPGWLAVFAPPWNDVHPQLPAAVQISGYRGLSAAGEVHDPGGARVDVHLDLLRWRGGPRFRGRVRLHAELASELRIRRLKRLWNAPIGLMTHHLDHDEAAWRFLEDFLAWTRGRPEFVWRSLDELLIVGCETADR